eukprot:scaffold8850_cov134-Isochrysis_galbana.AAC.8
MPSPMGCAVALHVRVAQHWRVRGTSAQPSSHPESAGRCQNKANTHVRGMPSRLPVRPQSSRCESPASSPPSQPKVCAGAALPPPTLRTGMPRSISTNVAAPARRPVTAAAAAAHNPPAPAASATEPSSQRHAASDDLKCATPANGPHSAGAGTPQVNRSIAA